MRLESESCVRAGVLVAGSSEVRGCMVGLSSGLATLSLGLFSCQQRNSSIDIKSSKMVHDAEACRNLLNPTEPVDYIPESTESAER